MPSTFPYMTINNLTEFAFIAGSDQNLFFDVYTSGSVAVDLSGASVTWHLARYGTSTAIVSKSGTVSGSPINKFSVRVVSSDTSGLEGKFIQQYSITDVSGSVIRPAQGLIHILAALS